MLFEYDERFAVFKHEFVYYDFQQPLKLQADLKGTFDRVICDPPFLSEDCQTKGTLEFQGWLAEPEAADFITSCTYCEMAL